MTTGKTIALTRWNFVGKEMSLLFNMLSRLVITFLTRSKCLLISWLQSPSAVILKPPIIQSLSCVQFWDPRLPCPSLSLRVCSNSTPLSQWCHLEYYQMLFTPNIFAHTVCCRLLNQKPINHLALYYLLSSFFYLLSSFSLPITISLRNSPRE